MASKSTLTRADQVADIIRLAGRVVATMDEEMRGALLTVVVRHFADRINRVEGLLKDERVYSVERLEKYLQDGC